MDKKCIRTGISGRNLYIGQKEAISKKIENDDVLDFIKITGDNNPVHVDEEYAANTVFGGRIAHGMIGAGLISAVIGTKLPGPGTIYLGQELSFKNPVRIGEVVTATAVIEEIIPKSKFQIVKIKTTCVNAQGEVVIDGRATVIPPQ